jgi:beta-lactamase regulating signal transducer with metallopeptidase domain
MNGILAVAADGRQLDVAVAVCVLLLLAALFVRLVWQPAKRLWIIEWALACGLLLALGWIVPWQRFSLGVVASNQAAFHPPARQPTSEHTGLLNVRNSSDAKPNKVATEVDRVGATSSSGATATKTLNQEDRATPPATPPLAATAIAPGRWSHWILGAYAIGSAGMALWLAAGQWTVHWLVRRAVEPELTRAWQQLHAEMQPSIGVARPEPPAKGVAFSTRRPARLLISNDLSHPIAVGVFRPAVLLPQWLVQSCDPADLRPVLAHELAHIMHRDAALRWLAAIFQVAFFYQPLYWWLRHELRLCQEYLADAQAATWAPSSADYAEQLVSLFKAAPTRS